MMRGARLEELATSVLEELARAEVEVEQSSAKLAATTEDEYGVLRAECRSFVRCFNALLDGKDKMRGGGRSKRSTGMEHIEHEGGTPLAAHLHELFTGIISKRIASVRQYVYVHAEHTHMHTDRQTETDRQRERTLRDSLYIYTACDDIRDEEWILMCTHVCVRVLIGKRVQGSVEFERARADSLLQKV